MTEEEAFLHKLLEQPNNDLTRLVYADWLDEQQTPDSVAKAEFLRLIADVELAGRHPERVQALARKLDSQWLAVASKLALENCELTQLEGGGFTRLQRVLDFQCPKRWEELATTDRASERFCATCRQTVYYCTTIREAKSHAALNECVAIQLSVRRNLGDLSPDFEVITVGLPSGDDDLREEELEREKQIGEDEDRAAEQRRRRR